MDVVHVRVGQVRGALDEIRDEEMVPAPPLEDDVLRLVDLLDDEAGHDGVRAATRDHGVHGIGLGIVGDEQGVSVRKQLHLVIVREVPVPAAEAVDDGVGGIEPEVHSAVPVREQTIRLSAEVERELGEAPEEQRLAAMIDDEQSARGRREHGEGTEKDPADGVGIARSGNGDREVVPGHHQRSRRWIRIGGKMLERARGRFRISLLRVFACGAQRERPQETVFPVTHLERPIEPGKRGARPRPETDADHDVHALAGSERPGRPEDQRAPVARDRERAVVNAAAIARHAPATRIERGRAIEGFFGTDRDRGLDRMEAAAGEWREVRIAARSQCRSRIEVATRGCRSSDEEGGDSDQSRAEGGAEGRRRTHVGTGGHAEGLSAVSTPVGSSEIVFENGSS